MKNRMLLHAVIYCIYFFTATTAYSSKISKPSSNLLDRLLGSRLSKPIVVVLNVGSKTRSSDFDDLLHEMGGDEDDGLQSAEEENTGLKGVRRGRHDALHMNDEAYFLYHLLKNVLEEGGSSSSSEDNLGQTKGMLRSALRSRCRKVDKCVKKCPPKRPSCPANCQEVFDELNLCPPPPPPPCDPCAKKRGKTMPPKWKL